MNSIQEEVYTFVNTLNNSLDANEWKFKSKSSRY